MAVFSLSRLGTTDFGLSRSADHCTWISSLAPSQDLREARSETERQTVRLDMWRALKYTCLFGPSDFHIAAES